VFRNQFLQVGFMEKEEESRKMYAWFSVKGPYLKEVGTI